MKLLSRFNCQNNYLGNGNNLQLWTMIKESFFIFHIVSWNDFHSPHHLLNNFDITFYFSSLIKILSIEYSLMRQTLWSILTQIDLYLVKKYSQVLKGSSLILILFKCFIWMLQSDSMWQYCQVGRWFPKADL